MQHQKKNIIMRKKYIYTFHLNVLFTSDVHGNVSVTIFYPYRLVYSLDL